MTDNNFDFEKMVNDLDIDVTLNQFHRAKLKQQFIDAAQQKDTDAHPKSKNFLLKNLPLRITVAAIIIFAIIVAAVYLIDQSDQDPTNLATTIKTTPPEGVQDVPQVAKNQQDTLAAKFAEIEKMFDANDVKGLMALLDDDNENIRVAAAGYLAKIGDVNAIKRLIELSLGFDGGGVDPFMLAIAEIQQNIAQQDENPEQTNLDPDTDQDQQPQQDDESQMDRPFEVEVIYELTSDIEAAAYKYTSELTVGQDAPVAGARVEIHVYTGDEWTKTVKQASSDADGYALFDIGTKKVAALYISAEKKGYVPMDYYTTDQLKLKDITDFTISLQKGVQIGGTVVNERGDPIQGVDIRMLYSASPTGDTPEPVTKVQNMEIKTDKNGKWSYLVIRDNLENIYLTLKHPDYANQGHSGQILRMFSEEQLIAKTARSVMRAGITVIGYVYDKQGNPVEGASVYNSETNNNNENSTKTNPQGFFEFKHVVKNMLFITAIADGLASHTKTYVVSADSPPIEIILESGSSIYGRVIDKDGKPVEAASVRNDQWDEESVPIKWSTETDPQGRFVWENAPLSQVKLSIIKQGYYKVNAKLKADLETEHEFVLYPELVVAGKVYDAQTNQPIENFEIIPGLQWNDSYKKVTYQTTGDWIKSFTQGNYQYVIKDGLRCKLKAVAQGYAFSESRFIYPDEEHAEVDFYLEKIDGPDGSQGIVYSPQGLPVQGAKVYVTFGRKWLHFTDLRNENNMNTPVITDQQGRFSFTRNDETYLIVVIHPDKGFAEITEQDFEISPEIHLTEWGKVQGQVFAGTKPVENAEIQISFNRTHDQQRSNYVFIRKSRTDADGKFTVDKVRPDTTFEGNSYISRVTTIGYRTVNVDTKPIEVKPGETTYVVLGGQGRTVTAKLLKPHNYTDAVIWQVARGHVKTNTATGSTSLYMQIMQEMQYPRPPAYDTMTVAQVLNWFNEWSQSEDGRQFQTEIAEKINELTGPETEKQAYKSYNVVINNDGTLQVDNIPEGEYTIEITLYGIKGRWGNIDRENVIGKSVSKFSIPEITDDNIDTPLDLGTLQMQPPTVAGFTPDQPAPPYEFKTLQGKTVKLTDYRGKYLLLNFWSVAIVHNQAREKQFDFVKQAHDTFAGPNFDVLGITPYQKSAGLFDDLTLKYIKEKDLTWTHAILPQDFDLIKNLNIYQYMNNIIIDPQGKVIEVGTKPEDLNRILKDILPE